LTSLASYLLCGTPRTGSTLLCSLLASTGVAGRPESYFREPDQRAWAARFGVPVAADGSFDYRAFAAGAVRAGSTPNGVFGARIMWGTMQVILEGLRTRATVEADLDVLTDAFGELRMVHLQRGDVAGQAVSWARAEQTSYWQDGDLPTARPAFDYKEISELVRTIEDHNAAWSAWFDAEGVQPHVVMYEDLVTDPRRTVLQILDHLGIEMPADWRPTAYHRQQADEINADWKRRYRQNAARINRGTGQEQPRQRPD
jgi:LPS sulfotransferase NodH